MQKMEKCTASHPSVNWIFSHQFESKMKHPIQRKRCQARNYQSSKNGLRFMGNLPMNEMMKLKKDENDHSENKVKNFNRQQNCLTRFTFCLIASFLLPIPFNSSWCWRRRPKNFVWIQQCMEYDTSPMANVTGLKGI